MRGPPVRGPCPGARHADDRGPPRGPANAAILVPMMDKNDEGRRSHYLTLQFAIPDAPGPDEIVIVIGAATTGRPHHRIGDRYKDLEELGHDLKNPAAVK